MGNFPHRDDVDLDVIKQLEEMFPNKKIMFLGDMPENQITEEHESLVQGIQEYYRMSLDSGICVECGTQITNWNDKLRREIPTGWTYLTQINKDEPVAWICDDCNQHDDDEDEEDEEKEEN
mgnify:CR=1 FL=1